MKNFKNPKAYPLWMRTAIKLLSVVLVYMILSTGRFVLMPLALSGLMAMLLEPLCKQLERLRIGRVAAIALSMISAFLVIAGILSLFSIQLVQFADELPQAADKLQSLSKDFIAFFQHRFGIAPAQQVNFVQQYLQRIINRSGQILSTFLGTTTSIFSVMGLLPFFIFFMLYYKEMYLTFLNRLWGGKEGASVQLVLHNIQSVARNYIIGLIMVITILSTLNSLGLWLIGMEHVLFFALFASFLAIIPYIGIIMGGIPAVLYALLISDSVWMPVGVICVFGVTQFFEGNFITPNIVGARVSINPFIALIALVIGGHIWGIVGMIIFVPFVGIIKCVLDEVDGLRPYGYLLGNKVEYTPNPPRDEARADLVMQDEY